MIRTPRCLRKSTANLRRSSFSRGAIKGAASRRAASVSRISHSNLEKYRPPQPPPVVKPDNRVILHNGIADQFDEILSDNWKGFSSSIPLYSQGRLLTLSPTCCYSTRNLSFSSVVFSKPNLPEDLPSKNQKITLWSKVGPVVKPIPGKIKRGLQNYVSDIDMSKYENLHWSLTPARKIIFTGLVFRKIGSDIVHGVKHLGSSLKLFWLNSKIGVKIAMRIMKGEQVSAIERNRMKRALADIFLMFPFSIFVIIPGAELLIPVYLKIFPGAMPSSFESLSQKEKRTIKQTQARLDLASFLHETLNEVQKKQKATANASMTEFVKFTKQVRNGNKWITNNDIRKFAPLFQEHLTIEAMDRPTLDALCKIFKANPVKHRVSGAHGEFTQSTQLIRLVLNKRLHELKYQDLEWMQIIRSSKTGIKQIPDVDLQDLNRDRGMRAAGLTRERLEQQYLDWLELANDPVISDSLLAYTRILYMPTTLPKLATAMEKSIDKKKPKRKDEVKHEEPTIDVTSELVDTAPVDDERTRLYDRVASMKITLTDVEAILESIKETKRLLKPIAATKDELLEGVQRNDRELDDDRVELLNPAIVKQIEKLNLKAETTAATLDTESGDVAVEARCLSTALSNRGVTDYKIGKIMRSMDHDGDGEISLDELEYFVNRIKEEISSDNTKDGIEILEILSKGREESEVRSPPPTPDKPGPSEESRV